VDGFEAHGVDWLRGSENLGDRFAVIGGVAVGLPDTLQTSLGENTLRRELEELILQRRRPQIWDKDIHGSAMGISRQRPGVRVASGEASWQQISRVQQQTG
jgi:hypothetical protein